MWLVQATASYYNLLRAIASIALQVVALQSIASRWGYCKLALIASCCKPLRLLKAIALHAIAVYMQTIACYHKQLHSKPLHTIASYCELLQAIAINCKLLILLQAITTIASYASCCCCVLLQAFACFFKLMHCKLVQVIAAMQAIAYYCKLVHTIECYCKLLHCKLI